jgi:hypothetical protein
MPPQGISTTARIEDSGGEMPSARRHPAWSATVSTAIKPWLSVAEAEDRFEE